MSSLPEAARPFVTFGTLLRAHGFAVAPEQTTTFLEAIGLLGPRRLADIARAAHATLGPAPERRAEFDALFRRHFLGEVGTLIDVEPAADEDEVRVQEDGGRHDLAVQEIVNEAGQAATAEEALTPRGFVARDPVTALRRLAREAPAHLPRRRGYRFAAAPRGPGHDMRQALRRAVRNDGEVLELPRLARKTRLRRVLLLIDVSGSMKDHTDGALRVAHVLTRAVERIEVFTLGTRLTRVTRPLRLRRSDRALDAAAATVADWDGGTRLGDTLQAFLAVPRFASYARGAVVLVLSDGLERGDHAALVDAMTRLRRLAWRLTWLTPLATAQSFRPETEALKAVLPLIDDLAPGGSVEQLCAHVLGVRRAV